MNRTGLLIGILVLAAGVAVYIWTTSGGTEVDNTFANLTQPYLCPHCNTGFELTGAESSQMIADMGGITCTNCGKKIDDFIAARADTRTLGGGGDDVGEETAQDEPDRYVGTREAIRN